MTLPNTGTITAEMINIELGRAGNTSLSLNDADVRALAGVPSGTVSFSKFHGKTASLGWSSPTEVQTQSSYTGNNPSYFGRSIALSGDGNTVAVGAYRERAIENDIDTQYFGAVYIFVRSGNSWIEQVKLVPLGPADFRTSPDWGSALTLSDNGNHLIASAPGIGNVYYYTRSGSTWTLQQTIAGPVDGSIYFGAGLAMNASATHLAINQYGGNTFLYSRSGSTWTQYQELVPAPDDRYAGTRCSISDDGASLMLGAHRGTVNGITQAGSVIFYTRSGSTWTKQQTFTSNDVATEDYFGAALSISGDGNVAVIGAFRNGDPSHYDQGAAYIFTRSGNTWTQQQKIIAGDYENSNWFGQEVSISPDGSVILVGCTNGKRTIEPYSGYGIGSAYIFINNGGTWVQTTPKIQSASPDYSNGEDSFGSSCSLSNDGKVAAIGASDGRFWYEYSIT